MKRSIQSFIPTLLLLWFAVTAAQAQRASYAKMNPFVRQASIAAHHQAPRKVQGRTEERWLTAFLRLSGDDASVLERYGVRSLARFGMVHIVSIPLSQLDALSLDPAILRIESGQSCSVQMDTTRMMVDALPVYEGRALPHPFDGEGVVVGVQDIGFDLTHPTFYSRDLSQYRIKALWDQLSPDTIGSDLYVGRDYQGQTDLLALGRPYDGDTQTHGTHTAGIAAGSGYDTSYMGMAPAADLCLVCNATSNDAALIDTALYYKYTYATDALGFKYIFDYADKLGRPCVINFSEGSSQDFHGDDQLFYEILDSLTGPGHILVASAGNSGNNLTYFRKPVGQPHAGLFLLGSGRIGTFTLKSADPFTIHINTYEDRTAPSTHAYPTGCVCSSADSLLVDTLFCDGQPLRVNIQAYPSSYDSTETCYDVTLSQDSQLGVSFPIATDVVGTTADVSFYYDGLWTYHDDLDTTLTAGEHTHSIHSPGSAPCVICVGANSYRTHFTNYYGNQYVFDQGLHGTRAGYSSVGPTHDGRTKPDVVAPGTNVVSAYSSYYIDHPSYLDNKQTSDISRFSFEGRTYAWTSDAGTSMAAPVVTGAVALWLQANPSLTPEDVLDVLAHTSRQVDPTLTYPNNLYGYGEIDVYRGLLYILGIDQIQGLSTTPLRHAQITAVGRQVQVTLDQPAQQAFTVSLYTTQGHLLLRQTLSAGNSTYHLALPTQAHGLLAVQVDGAQRGSALIQVR